MPELRTSLAVLTGVSQYRDETLPTISAAPAGVARLRELLQRPPGTFLSENVVTVINPGRHELLKSVQQAADKAEDTLLVYFAGHGLVSPKGDLLLATSDTESHAEYSTAPYDAIQDLISGSRAHRNVVILDCCFSGRALEAMGPLGALADIPSAYVITATSSDTAAFAPAGSRYTQFTGALIQTLQEGITGGHELLTVSDLAHRRVTYWWLSFVARIGPAVAVQLGVAIVPGNEPRGRHGGHPTAWGATPAARSPAVRSLTRSDSQVAHQEGPVWPPRGAGATRARYPGPTRLQSTYRVAD